MSVFTMHPFLATLSALTLLGCGQEVVRTTMTEETPMQADLRGGKHQRPEIPGKPERPLPRPGDPTPAPNPNPIPDPNPAPDPTPVPPPATGGSAVLGTNLVGLNYWSSAYPFVDGMRTSGRFRIYANGAQISDPSPYLDTNGWVKSIPSGGYAETYLWLVSGWGAAVPTGPSKTLVILYEGEGKIEYHAGFGFIKDEAASKPGRDVVVDAKGYDYGFPLKILSTNPNNYLRNIRVVPLEAEQTYKTQPFNPEYISKVKPFSVFRYMGWQDINGNQEKNWADRPTPQRQTWAGDPGSSNVLRGAPVEIMVQFANTTKTHPWFCMPHMATDDYVRQFATYVRNNLDPSLKIYVEYTNEAWNYGFPQANWIKEQGMATWPNDTTKNEYEKASMWFSKRTTEVTTIWDSVFGADKARVIGVMGAQAAGTWHAENYLLNYSSWTSTPKSNEEYGIDVVAIAPYFGYYFGGDVNEPILSQWAKEADGGMSKIFQEINQGGLLKAWDGSYVAGGALNEVRGWMSAYATLAKSKDVGLVAYEGGQHLVPGYGMHDNPEIIDMFAKANRDSRMGAAYTQYLNDWRALSGGGLMSVFEDIGASSKWGYWGLLEHVKQDGSAKYDAIMKVIQGTP